jgi:hypothetical protein
MFQCPIRELFTRLIAIVLALAVVAAFAIHFELAGCETAIEFSPDKFCHRSYRSWQILGVRVTPVRRTEWRSAVDEYLHSRGYITEVNSSAPRWLFVKGSAPRDPGWSGKDTPICQELGCFSGSDRWVKWSNEHPDLAQSLWPQVVNWLRQGKSQEVFYVFRFTNIEEATTSDDVRNCFEKAIEAANR